MRCRCDLQLVRGDRHLSNLVLHRFDCVLVLVREVPIDGLQTLIDRLANIPHTVGELDIETAGQLFLLRLQLPFKFDQQGLVLVKRAL